MADTSLLISGGINIGNKVRLYYDSVTNEAGIQVKLTNKSGGNSVKGYIVTASDGTNRAFKNCVINSPDIIGVVAEAGIADGSECWVWMSGSICQVYYIGNTTRGYFARNLVTADGGSAGQAIAEALPSSPFATDKHFQEIGHLLESRVGAGLALTNTHFN